MQPAPPATNSWLWGLSLLGALALLSADPAGALAQADIRLPAKEPNSVEKETFMLMTDGRREMQAELMKKVAEYYVHRLTWIDLQRKGMDALVQDGFRRMIPTLPGPNRPLNEKQTKFVAEFAKILIDTTNEVLKNPEHRPIVKINATRFLVRLAQAGHQPVADDLIKLVEDKDHSDAVKVWAVQGLKDLLVLGRLKDPLREQRCIQALLAFLARKPPPANLPPEEEAAFKYIRRLVVRTLSEYKLALLTDDRKVLAKPALELLRLMRNDGFTPEPSLKEKLEAAIGLCQIQSKPTPSYQPDYAARSTGQFVVEFAREYESDRQKTGAKSEAWKILAARLSAALSNLNKDAAANTNLDKAVQTYVNTLVGQVQPVLRDMVAGRAAASPSLTAWVEKNLSPSTSLYKGDQEAVLRTVPKAETP